MSSDTTPADPVNPVALMPTQEVPFPTVEIVAASDMVDDNGLPAAVAIMAPPEWDIHHIDPTRIEEAVLPRPRRHRGDLQVENVASFIDAVQDRVLDGNPPTLWASQKSMSIVAVLNGAHGDVTGFGDYRVTARIERSQEWQQWLAGSGTFMSQDAFADFVEDHLPEFLEPSQADMLELAQTFTATSHMHFKRATSTQSGVVSLQADATESAAAGKDGRLDIPERFKFGVRLFVGGEVVAVSARFRYRIGREGDLLMGWRLDQPEELERTLFDELVEQAGEVLGRPVIRGVAHA